MMQGRFVEGCQYWSSQWSQQCYLSRPPSRKYVNFIACFLNNFKQFYFNYWCSVMLNMRQNCIRSGLCPGPYYGSLWRSPDSLVVWEWRRPIPIPLDTTLLASRFDLGAFGTLFLTPPPSWYKFLTPGYATTRYTPLSKNSGYTTVWQLFCSLNFVSRFANDLVYGYKYYLPFKGHFNSLSRGNVPHK